MGFGRFTSLAVAVLFFQQSIFWLYKKQHLHAMFFSLDKVIFQAYPLWFPMGAVKQHAKPNSDKNDYLWGFLSDVLGKMVFKLHLWADYPATPQTSLWSRDQAA